MLKNIFLTCFLCFVCLLWIPAALAIVSINENSIGMPAEGMTGALELSVAGKQGNSQKLDSNIGGRLLLQHGIHTELLLGSASYGKSNGVRDTSQQFIHIRHRSRILTRWDAEVFVQQERDAFTSLASRKLLGLGGRFTVAEREDVFAMYLGLGILDEWEQRTGNLTNSRLWRANSYANIRMRISSNSTLQSSVYYQPALQDSADYRLFVAASFLVDITNAIALKIDLNIKQDTRTPVGVKKTDTSYFTGLQYGF
ncbi:MAG: DUF481 domain-containing protein [Mariprofundales bacterium]